MSLEGRKEPRIAVTTPVYLIRTGDSVLPDLAMTENVSAYGARLLTSRPCQVGEAHRISPFPGEYHLKATVVYCTPRPNHQYCIGFKLNFAFTDWWSGVFGQRRAHEGGGPQLWATAAESV
jgi:hypothetical protein